MVIVETIAVSTMVCNDLVMPLLLRTRGFGARAGGDLSGCCCGIRRAAIVARPAARLPVLPHRRRGLRAGQHRADQLRRGRAVRAGDARRHVLERRHARRRAGRPARRLRALGLHADAAVDRQVGLDRRPGSSTGPFGIALAAARAAVRPRRARQPDACAVLEPARQRRRCTSALSLWRAAVGARGEPGAALRRRVRAQPRRRRRRPGVLARPRPGWPTCAAGQPLPRRGARASSCSTTTRGAAAWPRSSRSRPTRGWCSSSRRSSPAPSAAPRRGSMVASVVEEEPLGARRRDADPRRGLAAARATRTRWRRSRARWSARPPSCAPPTSSSRASTG